MAIITNTSTEIGDVIIIKSEVPIVGLTALTSFVDDTDGETASKFFEKKFRYSVDGVNFTDFVDLTLANIAAVTVTPTDTFIVEYHYIRSGIDATSTLAFNSITLDGQFVDQPPGQAFKNSILFDFLGDNNTLCTLNWAINVLEKIYKKGLLPNYITRDETSSNTQDKDFIDFWRSITHFFAYYVCLARKLGSFYTDPVLLDEFLTQRQLILCANTSFEDLVFLAQNYLDEIRQRGTIQIAKKKLLSSIDQSVSLSASVSGSVVSEVDETKKVDGELLRLICFDDDCDEFLFNLNRVEHLGWNVENSSPLYKGQFLHNNLNKAYEDTTFDKTKYPLINSVGVTSILDGVDWVFNVDASVGGTGIGGSNNFDKAININRSLDYEITFQLRQSVAGGTIEFGVIGFDIGGNIKNLKTMQTNVVNNTFFEITALNRTDKYYLVRGIIYGKNKSLTDTEFDLSLGFGKHLKFPDNNISRIIPVILLKGSVTGEIRVKNINIKPVATPFSNGFIQTNNFIHNWIVNRNVELTQKQVENNIRRYLIPYNSTFTNIYLNQEECITSNQDQASVSQSVSVS